MGRNAARVRELTEELLQTSFVLGDLREGLGVGAVQVGLGGTGRVTVARADDDDGVLAVVSNETVDVADEEVQARGAPQWPTRRCFTSSRVKGSFISGLERR